MTTCEKSLTFVLQNPYNGGIQIQLKGQIRHPSFVPACSATIRTVLDGRTMKEFKAKERVV
jgi:hypothetical protein